MFIENTSISTMRTDLTGHKKVQTEQ